MPRAGRSVEERNSVPTRSSSRSPVDELTTPDSNPLDREMHENVTHGLRAPAVPK